MFYTFGQNNSGGSFVFDYSRGITHFVIIEADSESEAMERAERIGLYFNGCSNGIDCSCCGDRWYSPDGPTTEPSIYGEVIEPGDVWKDKGGLSLKWIDGPEAYIHYLDGHFEDAQNMGNASHPMGIW
jgi:hypothetical protein